MNRQEDIKILKNEFGRRYFKNIKYPRINLDSNDIYIITEVGDTFDLISYEYYKNVEDYWILVVANNLEGDSRYIKPGTQFRIPVNIEKIKSDYIALNSK